MSRLKPKQQVPLCLVVIGIITAVLLASSCQSIHIPATRKPGDIISSNIVRRGDHARRSFLLSEMTYKSSVWIAHSGPQRFQDPRTVEEQPGLYSQSDNCNVCLTVSDTDYAHEEYFVSGKLYLFINYKIVHEVHDRGLRMSLVGPNFYCRMPLLTSYPLKQILILIRKGSRSLVKSIANSLCRFL